MKISKKVEIKAEIRNQLQSIKTVMELLSHGEMPSKELLQAADKAIKKIADLIKNL